MERQLRRLVVVLGDQLDEHSAVFDDFSPQHDALWMAEVREESTHVPSHQMRSALFLSAMRHFRDRQRAMGRTVHYRQLDDPDNRGSLSAELERALRELRPRDVVWVQPGEYRVQQQLTQTVAQQSIPLTVLPDRHFLCSLEDFHEHADQREQLRLEFFYREQRKKTGILMDGKQPIGGQWNFDADNRGSFGKRGPSLLLAPPRRFAPDALTQQVLQTVRTTFPRHVGDLDTFDWPVTPRQARLALDDFIEHRLADFGRYQDAMWTQQPYLYHSRLSAALNLKLLDPRQVLQAAEAAYHAGRAPLASVEGFIRQILGWREYVRGIYWRYMPQYRENNVLRADQPLPSFYWTGDTDFNCLRQALEQTLRLGYAHHIQRLMVTGLFALLLGVRPIEVHEWYLSVYVDAVEWVELPNTLGMSQFADGGIMASKPYVASGKYIQRMSNYCQGCRYDPAVAVGPNACPFTTLYWDFLDRHQVRLSQNPRMRMQLKNLRQLSADERSQIRQQAHRLREQIAASSASNVDPRREGTT